MTSFPSFFKVDKKLNIMDKETFRIIGGKYFLLEPGSSLRWAHLQLLFRNAMIVFEPRRALVNIYIFKPQYLFSILPCLSCQLTQITSQYFNLFLRKLIRSLSWILEDRDKEYQIKSLSFPKVLLFMMKKFIIFLVWVRTINCCIVIDKNRRIRTKYFLGIRICLINLSSERCISSWPQSQST